ncbi:NAD-dependent epimerase/dehydratase family protein [Brevibacterium samyangense]|uniref:NAD-dependent epimerase/dehydratase domain-containing protein n=1 Tax=Brevibacterium samyangense TaxID=366888 RepID=A0ABP5EM96_9MICO
MRVAVVGATGNVGTAVLRELGRREEVDAVLGLARRLPDTDADPYAAASWRTVDIGREESTETLVDAFTGVDAVVHLAWLIQPNSKRDLLRRVNVDGTARVLAAAAEAGVERICVASSIGAYSPVDDDEPRDESWPVEGVRSSHYSVDKAAQERLLSEFAATHPEVALSWLRPGLIFQEDAGAEIQRYFAGTWVPVQLLDRVRPPFVPLPAGVRTQVAHADDVARAYAEAIVRGARGPFNICSDEVLDAEAIAGIVGTGRTVPLPPAAIRPFLTAAHRARVLPMDAGWLDMAMGAPLLDTGRAKRELGWEARVSGSDALRILLDGMAEGRGASSTPMRPRTGAPADPTALPPEDHVVPETVDATLLRQYLSDHILGATGGMDRITAMAEECADTPVFADLSTVAEAIRQEHAFLTALTERQGFLAPGVSAPLARVGEKLARFKPYGRPPGKRSPSSLLLETEFMLMAVTGKEHGWLTMREHAAELGVAPEVFDGLLEDAREQKRILGDVHAYARARVFRT